MRLLRELGNSRFENPHSQLQTDLQITRENSIFQSVFTERSYSELIAIPGLGRVLPIILA